MYLFIITNIILILIIINLIEYYYTGDFIIYKENNNRRFGRIWSIILVNNELQMKIQRIYIYNKLPNNFYSNFHSATQEL